jgi:flagellar basal-body rod modification protein FlgD
MNVPTTTGANGSSTLSTAGTSLISSTSGSGEDEFLQLMMDQLQNQDPLNPSDPTQYLSELAQFSSVEQEMSIANTSATAADETAATQALQLLGTTVTYIDPTGATQTGVVSQVDFSGNNGPTLTVGGTPGVLLSSVTTAS